MFSHLKNVISSRIKFDATPVKLKNKKDEGRAPPAGGNPKISIFTKPNKGDERNNKDSSAHKNKKKSKKEPNSVNKVVFTNCSGLHLGNKHYNNVTKVVNNNYSKKAHPSDSDRKETNSDSKVESEPAISTSREIPKEVKESFNSIKMVTQPDFDIVKTFVFDWRKLQKRLCPYMAEVPTNLAEEEIIFFILQDWIQANARSATVGMLCSDLWEIGEAQAAKKLAIAHS
ncbi:uncharacterized protein LOC106664617 [Cimex lectularius]|uniref:Death domain-containing protein n=1 Tax=Cimex lectularius TaxID=79782 RepID=A0A8I6TFA5_CIMLE|nr:uncharacterized protein LOC106664617 [Cimex lectularius]